MHFTPDSTNSMNGQKVGHPKLTDMLWRFAALFLED